MPDNLPPGITSQDIEGSEPYCELCGRTLRTEEELAEEMCKQCIRKFGTESENDYGIPRI